MKPRLGITAGDPAGIGAEVTLKALNSKEIYNQCIPVVIGDKTVLEDMLAITGLSLNLHCISKCEDALGEYGTIDLLNMQLLEKRNSGLPEQIWDYGKISLAAGEAAFRYVERAIALAMDKQLAGIVTAPINKEAVNLAGHHYAGHTEILSDLTGTKNYAMILISGKLRVIHVTTHVSLRNAADLITTDRVLTVIRLAQQGLKLLGIEKPRIAVAGFNPHASENGLFGDEEKTAIIPAIEAAVKEGMHITGPLPPDTVFVKALHGEFDVVVAMYHDQGHIPLKLIGFRFESGENAPEISGINCTLGLPIIRTSVDHGTAFDRAGKNCSSEQSMTEALEAACTMAKYK